MLFLVSSQRQGSLPWKGSVPHAQSAGVATEWVGRRRSNRQPNALLVPIIACGWPPMAGRFSGLAGGAGSRDRGGESRDSRAAETVSTVSGRRGTVSRTRSPPVPTTLSTFFPKT